jgi:succinyl-CoA synthetase beta subunit
VLIVLLGRLGGTVDVTNGELYDAMLPDRSSGERFLITQTDGGVRISIVPSRPEQSASN